MTKEKNGGRNGDRGQKRSGEYRKSGRKGRKEDERRVTKRKLRGTKNGGRGKQRTKKK